MDTGLDWSFPLDIIEQVTTWDARVIGCTSDPEGVKERERREREMEENVMICLIRLNGSNCSLFPSSWLDHTYFHTYSEGPPSLALRIHHDISWNALWSTWKPLEPSLRIMCPLLGLRSISAVFRFPDFKKNRRGKEKWMGLKKKSLETIIVFIAEHWKKIGKQESGKRERKTLDSKQNEESSKYQRKERKKREEGERNGIPLDECHEEE